MNNLMGRAEGVFERMPTWVLLLLARVTARLRPLVPYPGWRFNAAEDDPTAGIRFRLAIWRVCHRRRMERPLLTRWHHGLRFHLYLGNDLSRQLFVAGCIEPNEFYLLDRVLSSGMVFVDVGANDGLYSLLAAAKVGDSGSVVAFEPSDREFSRLRANLMLNKLDWVLPVPAALSHEAGRARLRVADFGHEGHNTLGDFVYDTVEQARFEDVDVTTLDAFVAERGMTRIDAMKVDVEGAEMSVLIGAHRTLSEFHPLVIMELLDPALRRQGHHVSEVIDFLVALGYSICCFDDVTGLPVPVAPGDEYSDNIIAVHRSHPWKGID